MALNGQNNTFFANLTNRLNQLNRPTVPLSQSQSTPAPGTGNAIPYASTGGRTVTYDDGSTLTTNPNGSVTSTEALAPTAASKTGIGAPNDDQPNQRPQAIQREVTLNAISEVTSSTVVPQVNILDQLASYTYALSWYMLTPEQYTAMKKTAKLNTNQWSLLVQSGGSSAQTTGEAQTGTVNGIVNAVVSGLNITGTTGRNKYFALDYYLDNLTIDTTLQQNGAMNATTLEFDVTEPNGITLLANLNRAARDAAQQPAGSVQNTQYVMVIRFYGYDAQGNLITNLSQLNTGTPGATPNNINSVAVKYFPFIITELTFAAANKAVVYHIKGVMQDYNYAVGSGLGSVPYNYELVGETVSDILNGKTNSNVTGNSEGAARPSTPQPSVTTAPVNSTSTSNPIFSGAYDPNAGWSI
jgi:hypothetical protein